MENHHDLGFILDLSNLRNADLTDSISTALCLCCMPPLVQGGVKLLLLTNLPLKPHLICFSLQVYRPVGFELQVIVWSLVGLKIPICASLILLIPLDVNLSSSYLSRLIFSFGSYTRFFCFLRGSIFT